MTEKHDSNMKEDVDAEMIDEQGEVMKDNDIVLEELNEDGEVSSKLSITKLKEKIKELEKESKENLDRWNRARADYINFKKEVEDRRGDEIKFSSRSLIEKILPTLDAYDMAKANKEAWEKVDANWRSGIEYILGNLQKTLEGEGLIAYGKVGDTFDPHLHDSVESIESTDESLNDKLAQVMSSGYKLGNSILRPAKVKVYSFTNN